MPASDQFDVPRVRFGTGTLQTLPEEVTLLGAKAPFLLSTPQQTDQLGLLKALLQDGFAGEFTKATMHTPSSITDEAVREIQKGSADLIISIGGGSTVGLGKAIAIRTGLRHLSIPTTYAGSEMTPILGETAEGIKKTRSDPKILPDTVIYDAALTKSLPATMKATSGINAIAHAGWFPHPFTSTPVSYQPPFAANRPSAVEALYSQSVNPLIVKVALEGIDALAHALPKMMSDPSAMEPQSSALYGAWLCGICLGNADMSIHHKLCHALGGSFNLPHGETHTAILPHSLSYVARHVPLVMEKLAKAFPDSNGDALNGLNALLSKLPVKLDLKAFGLQESDIDKAADIAMSQPYWSPRPLERTAIRELIRRAWAGEPARADL